MKNKIIKAIIMTCMATMMITGCGKQEAGKNGGANAGQETNNEEASTKKEEGKEATGETQESGAMVTVTDAKGEVQIPAEPKRIVDISGNSDILSILGYSVVGTANSDAYDYTKFPTYLEDVLAGAQILGYSMQDTLDVEGILALEPDLIIISGVQEKMYEQLSQVAPTVMLQLAQTDWKEDVKSVATVMNKAEIADAWLADYEKKAKEVGAKMKEARGEETSYLSLLASGGQIFIFDKAGLGSILYEDMGMARPTGMPQQEDISLPVVTYEGLAEIDADYIFAVGTDDDVEILTENAVWNNMEAVKNGEVVELPSSPYFNIGYSSIGRLAFLDELSGMLENING